MFVDRQLITAYSVRPSVALSDYEDDVANVRPHEIIREFLDALNVMVMDVTIMDADFHEALVRVVMFDAVREDRHDYFQRLLMSHKANCQDQKRCLPTMKSKSSLSSSRMSKMFEGHLMTRSSDRVDAVHLEWVRKARNSMMRRVTRVQVEAFLDRASTQDDLVASDLNLSPDGKQMMWVVVVALSS